MLAHLLCPAMRDAARRGAAGAHRLEKQSRMIAVNLADDTLARSALAARPRTVIRGNQSTVPAPGPRRHQRRTRGAPAGPRTRTGRSGTSEEHRTELQSQSNLVC